MNWRVYAEELLEFHAKVFSFPIEEVTKEIVSEFKKEFFIFKKDLFEDNITNQDVKFYSEDLE